ncbi:MAG TPA: nucleotide pyrophosphohydrolase [Burkholderiales bacterium]|nr:nucleotide pyrophosphohydrolase [Burkholderiales bacterium]
MTTHADSLESLRERIVRFADERDWDQFHNPKNVVMALAVEAAELLEHFQWRTPEESASLNPEEKEAVALEAADVLLYLLRLCDKLGIDLAAAAHRKIAINEQKYPAHKSRGRSTKYDKL